MHEPVVLKREIAEIANASALPVERQCKDQRRSSELLFAISMTTTERRMSKSVYVQLCVYTHM